MVSPTALNTPRLAIIPARGGSKRIPRKNIREFAGRPIIAYSIQAALASGLFTEVMVSTDDDEIAEVARRYGAQVPFRRSPETASDMAGTAEVLIEVLNRYAQQDRHFPVGCCLYPIAPFVTAQLVQQTLALMEESQYDSVFPVLRHPSPIQQALRLTGKRVQMFWPENYHARSQDLPAAYRDAGQLYWFRSAALCRELRLFTDNSGAVVIPEMQSHDIDTVEDWEIAEFKYQYLMSRDTRANTEPLARAATTYFWPRLNV